MGKYNQWNSTGQCLRTDPDLPENIVSNVYMLADDTKVFKTINSPNLLCPDYLASWSSKWLLRFHPDKCRENNTAIVCIQPEDS